MRPPRDRGPAGAAVLRRRGHNQLPVPGHQPVRARRQHVTEITDTPRRLSPQRYDSILARLIVTPAGCWEWTGARDRQGYGRVGYGPRAAGTGLVHRVVYQQVNGRISPSLELDHLCRNPPCANPAHLEPVTHRENVLRGDAPALLAARNSAITECPQGHRYDERNTYIPPRKTGRECRTCRNDASRRWRQARRAG